MAFFDCFLFALYHITWFLSIYFLDPLSTIYYLWYIGFFVLTNAKRFGIISLNLQEILILFLIK